MNTINTYAIKSAGTSGQVWTSDGSGAGKWADLPSSVAFECVFQFSTTKPMQVTWGGTAMSVGYDWTADIYQESTTYPFGTPSVYISSGIHGIVNAYESKAEAISYSHYALQSISNLTYSAQGSGTVRIYGVFGTASYSLSARTSNANEEPYIDFIFVDGELTSVSSNLVTTSKGTDSRYLSFIKSLNVIA